MYFFSTSGTAIEPNDPNWARLTATARTAKGDPGAWLGMADIYGEVGRAPAFVQAFSGHLAALWRDGARAVLTAYLKGD